MKAILFTILILIISSFNVSAQYIEGQENIPQDGIMTITTLSVVNEEPRMCTMEYAPVCAQVQVQCVKEPCFPITQTFGNTCSAGENPILFQGECEMYIDTILYNKLESKRTLIEKAVSNLGSGTLIKMNEIIDQRIESVKKSRIAREVQQQRITKYTFIKSVILSELNR